MLTFPSPDPTVSPPVADAEGGNWVDRYAPPALQPWLRLARLDRPIGTWLLLLPCWWSQLLAEIHTRAGSVGLASLILFALGALVMRGAGCAWNDLVDRDYDAQVARTKSRPIPSGQVTPAGALACAVLLSLVGLAVLLQFNEYTIWLAIGSLVLVAIYPFMKRYTYWPQLVLGLAFNWGALVGWASVEASLALAPALLYLGSVLWTLGYDTIYAHQDAEDDLMVGLKSTALKFGDQSPTWVAGFYAGAVALWGAAAWLAGVSAVVFVALGLVACHFAWQVRTLDIHDGTNCLRRFRSNRLAGVVLFLGLLANALSL